jgi:large subunit ribosomal protein L9
VTSSDIAEALKAQSFEIDKRRIELPEPIKVVGEYEITAKLAHGVTATFKVSVSREG